MRILQVNKFYPPVVGGIENVVGQLAEGLAENGHEARVLAARPSGFGGVETRRGVTVYRTTSLGTVHSTPIAPTFPMRLRRLAAWADVVHYHLPSPISVSSHLVVRPDTPTVVTYHSDIVRQQRALRVYRPVLERFLADVDRIVTTSPRLRERSPFLQPHAEKTSVVPLAIDLEAQESGSAHDPPVRTDDPIVLFVGRLNYYKGVSVLLNAMAIADTDGTLVIVGDGDRRARLERTAEAVDISDDVYFLGHVDDEMLRACYGVADLFVLPSVEPSEAFGIVQLEAMAHEIPIINTALPTGVPWVSRDGVTGLTVPPNDEHALAHAIDALLSDADRRRTYGHNGRQRVESMFTEDRMISDTLEIYRSLLADRRGIIG